jgi:phage terminase large subunit-like protein
VFKVNADGIPANRDVYIEIHRGAFKTGAAAAVAITEALLQPSTEVIVVAADQDQGGLLMEAARGFIARNQLLQSAFVVNKWELIVPSNGSRIRVMSSDVASSWGVGGTHTRLRIIFDELTAWPDRGQGLYESLASATTKTPDSQLITMTNAGVGPGVAWQWKVREQARLHGYLYAPQGLIASFIDHERVEQFKQSLPPNVWRRLYGNEWVTAGGDFITAEQYANCVDESLSPVYEGVSENRYYAGLDLGLNKDRTALAVVTKPRRGKPSTLVNLHVWEPRAGQPVSITEVESALLDISRRYPGIRIAADPWQLKGTIERLRTKIRIFEFPFTSTSVARLSETLFAALTGRGIRLYPDAGLRDEILNLQTKSSSSGWRVDHTSGGFSDRAMALAMALQQAMDKPRGNGLLGGALYGLGRPRTKSQPPVEVDSIKGAPVAPPPPETQLRIRCAVSKFKTIDQTTSRTIIWLYGDTGWLPESVARPLLAKGDAKLLEIKELAKEAQTV